MTDNDRLLCITMKTYSLSYSAGFLFHYFVLMLGSALHCILVAVTTLPIWNLDSGLCPLSLVHLKTASEYEAPTLPNDFFADIGWESIILAFSTKLKS